jgi:hypothetical protein
MQSESSLLVLRHNQTRTAGVELTRTAGVEWPFVCYYTDATNESTKHVSFVVVSENNTHDTEAVHLFQEFSSPSSHRRSQDRQNFCTFLMVVHHSTRAGKTLRTSVFMSRILECWLNATSLSRHIARVLVMESEGQSNDLQPELVHSGHIRTKS